MRQFGRIVFALSSALSAMVALVLAVQARAPLSPRAQDVTLTRGDGQITVTVAFGMVKFVPPPGVILQCAANAASATKFGRLDVRNPSAA